MAITAFIIVSAIISTFMAVIWRRSTFLNVFIKVTFISHAVWAVAEAFARLFPVLAQTVVKLY